MTNKQRLTYWLTLTAFCAVFVLALTGCSPAKPSSLMTCQELAVERPQDFDYWCVGPD